MPQTHIRGKQILDNDISSDDIADSAVRGTTANTAGTTQEIAQGTISTPDLRNDAVDASKLLETDSYSMVGLTLTGDITLGNAKSIIFTEKSAGTDTISLRAPDAVTTSYALQLPPAVGGAGTVLTDAAGNGVLSWATAAVSGANTTLSNLADTVAINKNLNNFSAGTITASLTGAASLNLLLTGGTLSGALTITPTTNQLVLGTTRTATISAVTPATSSRIYTVPDAGAAANFVLTEGANTINGAITLGSNIDVNKKQLLNAVMHTGTSEPGTPAEGQLFYRTDTHQAEIFNGTSWVLLG
jgi:hypothetical protein